MVAVCPRPRGAQRQLSGCDGVRVQPDKRRRPAAGVGRGRGDAQDGVDGAYVDGRDAHKDGDGAVFARRRSRHRLEELKRRIAIGSELDLKGNLREAPAEAVVDIDGDGDVVADDDVEAVAFAGSADAFAGDAAQRSADFVAQQDLEARLERDGLTLKRVGADRLARRGLASPHRRAAGLAADGHDDDDDDGGREGVHGSW